MFGHCLVGFSLCSLAAAAVLGCKSLHLHLVFVKPGGGFLLFLSLLGEGGKLTQLILHNKLFSLSREGILVHLFVGGGYFLVWNGDLRESLGPATCSMGQGYVCDLLRRFQCS